jgi:phosphatidylglycerol:prolipoprotein diacylglycerol transferase
MRPVLFEVFGFDVRSYGVLLMIGIILAAWVGGKRAAKYGVTSSQLSDGILWAVIPGILGARLAYILVNWSFYSTHLDELFSFRFEGLTSFGGMIVGSFGFWLWVKRTKLPMWNLLDAFAPAVLIASAVGRVGCLLNGCCFGLPTEGPLGLPLHFSAASHFPAQLIDSVLSLAFAGVIVLLEGKKVLKSGQSIALAAFAYGASRFVFEIFRANEQDAHGVWSRVPRFDYGISLGQVWATGAIILGVFLFLYTRRMAKAADAQA